MFYRHRCVSPMFISRNAADRYKFMINEVSFWLIGKCSNSTEGTLVRELCESPQNTDMLETIIPVANRTSHFRFVNKNCVQL